MNKFIITLATLAALSGSAMASQNYFDSPNAQAWSGASSTTTDAKPLAVVGEDNKGLSNFELQQIRADDHVQNGR